MSKGVLIALLLVLLLFSVLSLGGLIAIVCISEPDGAIYNIAGGVITLISIVGATLTGILISVIYDEH